MKKHLLLILAVAISHVGFAQLSVVDNPKPETIGKIAPMGKLHISCEKLNNTYTFTYSDVKFQQLTDYKTFSFKDIDDAFNKLYNTIMEGLANPPKEDLMLETPDGFIWLSYSKSMGVTNFRFGHSVQKTDVIGFSVWLTKKKVQKLFGKYSKKKKRR